MRTIEPRIISRNLPSASRWKCWIRVRVHDTWIHVSGRCDVKHQHVFLLFSVRWRRWSWSTNWMSVRLTWAWRSPFPGTMSTKTAPGYLSVRSAGKAAPVLFEYSDWSNTDDDMWRLIVGEFVASTLRNFISAQLLFIRRPIIKVEGERMNCCFLQEDFRMSWLKATSSASSLSTFPASFPAVNSCDTALTTRFHCPFPPRPGRYGEIVNINLVRDKKTGKSKGFCFICYEDQRSTVLAVDNFNGIKVTRKQNYQHPKRWRTVSRSPD